VDYSGGNMPFAIGPDESLDICFVGNKIGALTFGRYIESSNYVDWTLRSDIGQECNWLAAGAFFKHYSKNGNIALTTNSASKYGKL
jgi:hypothetical protein